jgi:thiol-disulfide isomerase/thioredoxin
MSAAPGHLVAACLCAQWCSSCREYRATFDRVAAAFPDVRFVWIDIEDEEALLGRVEVDNFPTLLLGTDAGVGFFGPLMPQEEVLARLVRTCAGSDRPAGTVHADVIALLHRVRAVPPE